MTSKWTNTDVGVIDGIYETATSRGDLHVQVSEKDGEKRINLVIFSHQIRDNGKVATRPYRYFNFPPDITEQVADLIREAGQKVEDES